MSAMEQALADYLQLRHSLGHDMAEAGWLLPGFVAYLDAHGLPTVTTGAALAWAQQAPKSPAGRVTTVGPRRMTAARGFARYLSGIDASTEVPPLGLMPHRAPWRRPFIYSAADIGALLEALRPFLGIVLEGGISLLLGIANGVVLFLLALFVAFFFYVYGDPLAERMQRILRRVAGPRADGLIEVIGATVRGVVYGIVGTAIVQGILTAFGLWLSGVPRPLLLGGVAGLLSVLPIGAPVVWIPAALWLLGTGHIAWGIVLAVYGVVAISGSDSIIRPWFIARGAHLPFMLTILGVLGGALAFGLLGIFLGPVLLGVGFTLLNEWVKDEVPEGLPPDE